MQPSPPDPRSAFTPAPGFGEGPDGLTAPQRKLVAYLLACLELKGRPPSFEEMREHLGLSSRGQVSWVVEALRKKGWLEAAPARAAHAVKLRGVHVALMFSAGAEGQRLKKLYLENCKR